ncbi:hypothetical protein BJ684DRAFT_20747, partial [Piptocephalis cylindrospora]
SLGFFRKKFRSFRLKSDVKEALKYLESERRRIVVKTDHEGATSPARKVAGKRFFPKRKKFVSLSKDEPKTFISHVVLDKNKVVDAYRHFYHDLLNVITLPDGVSSKTIAQINKDVEALISRTEKLVNSFFTSIHSVAKDLVSKDEGKNKHIELKKTLEETQEYGSKIHVISKKWSTDTLEVLKAAK